MLLIKLPPVLVKFRTFPPGLTSKKSHIRRGFFPSMGKVFGRYSPLSTKRTLSEPSFPFSNRISLSYGPAATAGNANPQMTASSQNPVHSSVRILIRLRDSGFISHVDLGFNSPRRRRERRDFSNFQYPFSASSASPR